jgi:hypothetical protein
MGRGGIIYSLLYMEVDEGEWPPSPLAALPLRVEPTVPLKQ